VFEDLEFDNKTKKFAPTMMSGSLHQHLRLSDWGCLGKSIMRYKRL
jgi:hypothetical protein